jgi:hypothetical protein
VDFKLHAPGGVVVRGIRERGEWKQLEVTPKSARKMLVLP